MENLFGIKGKDQPFGNYEEYMEYLFASVNEGLNRYLVNLKQVYATGEGGYKNVLYPDLEIAHDICIEKIERFLDSQEENSQEEDSQEENYLGSDPADALFSDEEEQMEGLSLIHI